MQELTGGGAEAVLECVGNKSSMDVAFGIARPGGTVGFVGQPHGTDVVNIRRMYGFNIGLRGGVAPVRAYIPELMAGVLDGSMDASPVLDMTIDLDGVAEATPQWTPARH